MRTKQWKKDGQRRYPWDRFCHAGNVCIFYRRKRQVCCCFTEKQRKKLAREQRKLSQIVKKEAGTISKQKKKVALCHEKIEKIKNQREDFQRFELSRELAEGYDAVCVGESNLQGMSGGLHLGKSRVQDNGYGPVCTPVHAWDTNWKSAEETSYKGRPLPAVRQELQWSMDIEKRNWHCQVVTYVCECGNRMDRDVNAAVNIRGRRKRGFVKRMCLTAQEKNP